MFEHSLEIMKFNTGFDFDVLLGTDILPKMNIGLTGVAFRLSSEHSHSDTATDEIQILENINIDQVNEFEPDNSPAGTAEQRANFFDTIKDVLKKNQIHSS
ncbi:hypothetical protein G6F43_014053 [Rhizopus delemar]|nr:hypothetical protein G6F43_014053 [Rhizopus delemar]